MYHIIWTIYIKGGIRYSDNGRNDFEDSFRVTYAEISQNSKVRQKLFYFRNYIIIMARLKLYSEILLNSQIFENEYSWRPILLVSFQLVFGEGDLNKFINNWEASFWMFGRLRWLK